MTIVTRFAPSPTGFLHIGGARTALFNMLYSRHLQGKYLVRVEDTDKKRSTDAAIKAILGGLEWMGLSPDEDIVFQSHNKDRHIAVAEKLLAEGKAYHCYCSEQELQEMREDAKKQGKSIKYNRKWRDKDASDAPAGIKPTLRLKAPIKGDIHIKDLVQSDITISYDEMDDFVLLRADKSPTYMLSVVVDDHDMNISHVIRGDDHLTNAHRQAMLYDACGWPRPTFAHIPLIHGADGAKLSKRHGALGVEEYKEMGYLPEALCNYILRLGWGHGNDEIISMKDAIQWFDIGDVGRAPSRFDFQKLQNLNAHYIRECEDAILYDHMVDYMQKNMSLLLSEYIKTRLKKAMTGLKQRAKTINELADNALFYVQPPNFPIQDNKAGQIIADPINQQYLINAHDTLKNIDGDAWNAENLQAEMRALADENSVGLGKIMQPLRIALTGQTASPSVFEIFEILEKSPCLERIETAIDFYHKK